MTTRTFSKSSLSSGKVYRTAEFAVFTANPARLVDDLEQQGVLRRLAHGLYMQAERTKFGGMRRPDDDELLSAYLGDDNFVVTGSDSWNSLGLGAKAVLATPLVYNHQRTGEVILDGRRFLLKRTKFPRLVTPEWFVVDLFENHSTAQLGLDDALNALVKALKRGRLSPARLAKVAVDYGSANTRRLVFKALAVAGLREQGFDRSDQGQQKSSTMLNAVST